MSFHRPRFLAVVLIAAATGAAASGQSPPADPATGTATNQVGTAEVPEDATTTGAAEREFDYQPLWPTPWTTTVSYEGADRAALTIVASTGGHVADVEQFAITGVRHAA